MEYHKKLAGEAYANDHVIHQNACADRKLQKELDYLNRMQKRERKRLEQEEHYFQTLHRIVPSLHPGEDSHLLKRKQSYESKPIYTKRQTFPGMSPQGKVLSTLSHSDVLERHCSPKARRAILNLNDIALDAPHGYQPSRSAEPKGLVHQNNKKNETEQETLERSFGGHGRLNTPRTAWLKSSETSRRLSVEGIESHLSERGPIAPRHATDGHVMSSKTKCSQFVKDNEKYLHDIIVESASSTSASTQENDNGRKGKVEASTPHSDQSEWDSTSEAEEKLPSLSGDKVGLRVLAAERPSFEMRMLYQMKNGHLEVPKVDTEKITKCTYASGDEMTRIEKLALNRGALRKTVSLDHRCTASQHALGDGPSDLPTVNGKHMTLVKFLPKSKQALYLKYGNESIGSLSNTWHAGDSYVFKS